MGDPKEKGTPSQRFAELAQKVLSVPKAEIDRRDKEWRKKTRKPR